MQSGKKFQIAPYRLSSDKLSIYNYLIGYICPMTQDEAAQSKIGSFRISRIASVQPVRTMRVELSEQQRERLEDEISRKGAPFLVEEASEIVIKLSEEGVRKYHAQLHLRPRYLEKRDGDRYVFHCTERQAEYYFQKFGRDAEVISPAHLRERFIHFYSDALEMY
ncbi:WYL domain-containing protein [Synergistaceae bacterium OttesenSCG-928-I11]|nr:WYL domain-containing protein [Synergistaceae bacterium OttesenSCG-928-I11]